MSRLLRVRGAVHETFARSEDDLDEYDEIDGEVWDDDDDDEEDWDDEEWDEEEDEEEGDDLWLGDEEDDF
jgi:hypothetical protein